MPLSLGLPILPGTLQVAWPPIAKSLEETGARPPMLLSLSTKANASYEALQKPSLMASSARPALGAGGTDLSQVWALPLRVLSWWESHTGTPKQEREVHAASGVSAWGHWGQGLGRGRRGLRENSWGAGAELRLERGQEDEEGVQEEGTA